MTTSLDRIRLGAVVLAITLVVSVLGFRYLGGYDWVDAVWLVVVTISSVGFSERSQLEGPGIKLFTVAVILFGMTAAGYTLGGLFQLLLHGEIEWTLGRKRMTRDIDRLSGHIIICGFGRIGHVLAEEMLQHKLPFVIIDRDNERLHEARERGFLHLLGDATEDAQLVAAGVARAKGLVIALPGDADNVFITLTARNLNPSLLIVARAEYPSTESKLRQAGANKVILPTLIGALQMARLVTRPSTADLIEMVAHSGFRGVELDELVVSESCRLVGVTVRETEAHRRHRLLVVAVKQHDGTMIFNPDADYKMRPQDVVMMMGSPTDIDTFRKHFGI